MSIPNEGTNPTKDKQRSTKHTHKAKDQVTRTPLKTNNDLQNIHIKLNIGFNADDVFLE
jgi:hypothetical protein